MRKKIAKYLSKHINNIYEGKKVLVIGSTGLLGVSLVSLLYELKAEITVSTTNKEKALRLFSIYNPKIIECNLLDENSVSNLILIIIFMIMFLLIVVMQIKKENILII